MIGVALETFRTGTLEDVGAVVVAAAAQRVPGCLGVRDDLIGVERGEIEPLVDDELVALRALELLGAVLDVLVARLVVREARDLVERQVRPLRPLDVALAAALPHVGVRAAVVGLVTAVKLQL